MAFSEDIITTIGADTRPFAKGLRTMKAQVAIVSKEMNGQMQTSLKAWLGFLGPAGVIAGLKKVFDLAKGVNEEGKEFTKGGWVSAENASVLNETAKAFENIFKSAVSLGAYTLGYIGKAARYLGALSVTGDLAEADRQVGKMEAADRVALGAAKRKLEAQAELVKLKKEELVTAEKKAEVEKKALSAQKAVADAKKDRSKFTLEELASSNVRFTGQLGKDQYNAQRITALEAQANALKAQGYGPQSQAYFSEADRLRKGLVNVVDSDRNPFKGLQDSANEQTLELMRLNRILEEQGIKVKNSK